MWFSTYPDKTTQANGAEIMIWLSHPNALAGGSEMGVDGTDWYLNEWITSGHGVSWPVIIFTHNPDQQRKRLVAKPVLSHCRVPWVA